MIVIYIFLKIEYFIFVLIIFQYVNKKKLSKYLCNNLIIIYICSCNLMKKFSINVRIVGLDLKLYL